MVYDTVAVPLGQVSNIGLNELLELFRFVLFGVPVGLVEFIVDIEDLFYFEGRFVVAADQNSFPFHFFICVVIQEWV